MKNFIVFFVRHMTAQGLKKGMKVFLDDFLKIPHDYIYWMFHFPIKLEKSMDPLLHSRAWVLNAWFIGSPLLILSIALLVSNFIFSIKLLEVWAHGNLLFVMLTVLSIF